MKLAKKYPPIMLARVFSDTFTGADETYLAGRETTGSTPNRRWPPSVPSTWTLDGSGNAINTPVLGEEKVTNGGFDSDTTGWVSNSGAVLESVAGDQDGNCLQITVGASNNPYATQDKTLVVGTWYKFSVYVKSGTEATAKAYIVNNSVNYWAKDGEATGDWVQSIAYFKAEVAATAIVLYQTALAGSGTTLLFDSVTLKPLTNAELFAVANTGFSRGYVKVTDTTPAVRSILGLAMCVDNPANPQNGFVAILNRTKAYGEVFALNNGTWTSLISTAVTYAANAEMHLLFDGTYLYFFYNNTLVGARQNVSAYTSIINNTYHGMFNVGESGDSYAAIDIKPIQLGPVLNVSDCENATFDTFNNASPIGFHVISDGVDTHSAGTADEISIVAGDVYRVDFNLDLTSGTIPVYFFKADFVGDPQSSTYNSAEGVNSAYLVAKLTTTGRFVFYKGAFAAEFTISNLEIRKVQ